MAPETLIMTSTPTPAPSPPAPPAPDGAVTLTIVIPADHEDLVGWLDLLGLGDTGYSDVFSTDMCGYWAQGWAWHADRGWLVRVADDAPESTAGAAEAAWKAGETLPPGWYRLDRPAALRALQAGVKVHGWPYFANGGSDYSDYDCAIQRGLLGEVVYG